MYEKKTPSRILQDAENRDLLSGFPPPIFLSMNHILSRTVLPKDFMGFAVGGMLD